MHGAVDHLMINANSYEAAVRFYSWLMPKIGYPGVKTFETPEHMTGFYGQGGSFWVLPAEDRSHKFDKGRVGLREIAFRSPSRELINELALEISSQGGRVLHPPREYQYRPGYYSVFFTDPDGLKLEVVHYTE
jgi:glyoxylase I family protein